MGLLATADEEKDIRYLCVTVQEQYCNAQGSSCVRQYCTCTCGCDLQEHVLRGVKWFESTFNMKVSLRCVDRESFENLRQIVCKEIRMKLYVVIFSNGKNNSGGGQKNCRQNPHGSDECLIILSIL